MKSPVTSTQFVRKKLFQIISHAFSRQSGFVASSIPSKSASRLFSRNALNRGSFSTGNANDLLDSYQANGALKHNGLWDVAEYDGGERDDFVRPLAKTEGTLGVFDPGVALVGPEYYRKIADEQLATLMIGPSTNVLQDGTPEQVATIHASKWPSTCTFRYRPTALIPEQN